MQKKKQFLLSFDIEEFDVPLEHGINIDLKDQIDISVRGTSKVLDILKSNNIRATFFSTVVFAKSSPEIIDRIIKDGHELASHGDNHKEFKQEHLLSSKIDLEAISKNKINGFRMARMMPVAETDIKGAGYKYNASINPCFIPGRYMNINESRTFFKRKDVLQIPASVTPIIRFPLFWLSYHNLPAFLYRYLVKITINNDKYFNTYFHPWEFVDLSKYPEYNIPFIIKKNSGDSMLKRLDMLIKYFKELNVEFITYNEFADLNITLARER